MELRKPDISSPKRTKEVLSKHQLTLKKSLGQNFLIDHHILEKITGAAELDRQTAVLEIGPGIGALTEQLARKAGTVVAVEIDQRLLPVLEDTLIDYNNIHVVHGDILKLDLTSLWDTYFKGYQRVVVVANLPYYITTPIMMRLLEERLPLERIVVMIQKEVADRMSAEPGGKQYGSLSIAVQYYCVPQLVTIVPRTVFVPQPNVDSAVLKLDIRKEPPAEVIDEKLFFKIVQASFSQRRKTIANNLLNSSFTNSSRNELEVVLKNAEIEPARRGETLSIKEFADLSNEFVRSEMIR